MDTSADSPRERRDSAAVFRTTRWTRVLEARGDSADSRAALAELCDAYYAPVFAFIRHNAPDEETARDLTQEFFARLLARRGIDKVDRGRGRFRSYLLGAVKHFLADARDHEQRAKRGGGQPALRLEAETDTSPGLQLPDTAALRPDREFDRKWALIVLERAMTALTREQRIAQKETHFHVLKPWLTGDTDDHCQADAARQLDLNEGAVKVAIHRLRRRFRELVKTEVSQTLNQEADVNDELACLVAALRSD